MNREKFDSHLDRITGQPETFAVLVSAQETADDYSISTTMSGVGSPAIALFVCDKVMEKVSKRLPLQRRCRLDYLRRELLRLLEDELDAEPKASPVNGPRLTLIN